MGIENTSQRDIIVHLAGMLGGSDSYITDMESAGQRQLVASSVLPIDGPWSDLSALGFTVGKDQDDLFRSVTLPDGWRKEGSDHAMWSYILDQRGVRVIAVFYKAAFYDRKAHWSFQNAGYSAASECLYGDGPATLPAHWEVFTDAERASFVGHLDRMAENIELHPDIYGKYAGRLSDIRALLELA